jgi:hypothetical protein
MYNALFMSLFVVSMSFAGSLNAEEVQANDADAACASDLCMNADGEAVACDSLAPEATNDRHYCGVSWGWHWNSYRGWHNHSSYHHRHSHRR